jgi:hypothetical protein
MRKVDFEGSEAILERLEGVFYEAEGSGMRDFISYRTSPMRQIYGRGLYSVLFYNGAMPLSINTLEK